MKIALVYLGRKGGGPVYSLEVAKRLQEKADCLAVISRSVDNLAEWRKIISNRYEAATYENKLDFLCSFFRWSHWCKLKKIMQDFQPDVIYYPFFHLWLPIVNWWFPRAPKVYTAHDPILHQGENSWLIRLMQNSIIKKSQRVIILSSVFKDAIVAQGIPLDRIDVVPHGIFDYYFKSKPVSLRQNHNPTLLFFGRIVGYKGIDVLLKAWPLVRLKLPNARLIIAGSGDLSPYQLLLKQEGIETINRWIADKEVADIFKEADVLVCPYHDASQSGAIPTAYAFKIPVVASDTGGLSEQVKHCYSGLLVKAGQEQELAEACLELLRNPSLRNQLGANGFRVASTQWSWDKVSGEIFLSLTKSIKF